MDCANWSLVSGVPNDYLLPVVTDYKVQPISEVGFQSIQGNQANKVINDRNRTMEKRALKGSGSGMARAM